MRTSDLVGRLEAARSRDGAWSYRAGEPSRVEPTLWTLLALDAAGAAVPADTLAWLAANQQPDGRWGGAEAADAAWVTAPTVFTLARLGVLPDARRHGEEWLLAARSETFTADEDGAAPFRDPELVGWPWTEGTFGWVEPTAHALLALRAAGRDHPRVAEAARFLLDRRCDGGGWNAGVVRALGVPVGPYPHTTALAVLALGAAPALRAAVTGDLSVLARFTEQPLGAFDLAWIALALDAAGADPAPVRARLAPALDAAGSWPEHVHALALATLATVVAGDANPFRFAA